MVDKFKPMHLFVDFHVGPSKEYLIFFLFTIIYTANLHIELFNNYLGTSFLLMDGFQMSHSFV